LLYKLLSNLNIERIIKMKYLNYIAISLAIIIASNVHSQCPAKLTQDQYEQIGQATGDVTLDFGTITNGDIEDTDNAVLKRKVIDLISSTGNSCKYAVKSFLNGSINSILTFDLKNEKQDDIIPQKLEHQLPPMKSYVNKEDVISSFQSIKDGIENLEKIFFQLIS
jgi:hypothetical protein